MHLCLFKKYLGIPYSVGLARMSEILSSSASVSSPALFTYKQSTWCVTNNNEVDLPLVEINLSNLEHLDGESSTNTLDDSNSKCNLMLSVDISVLHSQKWSEIVSFLQYK